MHNYKKGEKQKKTHNPYETDQVENRVKELTAMNRDRSMEEKRS